MSHDELLARHRAVLPSWLALYYDEPIELVEGEGRHVVDGEGNRYLDFFGGILTTMTGYDVPEVTAAIREQAGRMIHTSTLYLIRQQVELAEMIADLSGIPDARVFFTTSGTEANEAALLVATSFRRSSQIVAVRNSYHGRSLRHDRHHREPGLVPVVADPVPGQLHAVRLPLPEPVPPPGRRRLHRGLHRGPARCDRHPDRGGHRRPDRRAHPGRRRVRHPSRRLLRPGREGVPGARHALHRRRGADRLGPDRRPLLGPPGPRDHPRPDDLRQGPGQRADHRRRGRPGRDHGLGLGQLHLHLRRQPPVLRGGAGQPPLPAGPRPPGQHQGPGGPS